MLMQKLRYFMICFLIWKWQSLFLLFFICPNPLVKLILSPYWCSSEVSSEFSRSKRLVSSGKWCTLENSTASWNWLMKRIKKIGPNINLCGTKGPNFVEDGVLFSVLQKWSAPFIWIITYSDKTGCFQDETDKRHWGTERKTRNWL